MNDDSRDPPDETVVERIFSDALDLDSAEQPAFLDKACGGNGPLRRRVEALLAASQASIRFLPDEPRMSAEVGAKTERAGDRIGPYMLIEELGSGGFGVVWKALQEIPRREVALKILRVGLNTPEATARFQAECQTMAEMDHPNIAKVYAAGATATGRPFFGMELLRGTKINEYCDQHHLSTRQRIGLFTQVCKAIQHAHLRGVIHRDITPSNVLVVEQDGAAVAKVIDFGIAKGLREPLAEIQTGQWTILGNVAYMSPEQAAGGGDIDARTDIYGLGALLYELLAGRPPLEAGELRGSALEAMCRAIREAERPTPSARLKRLKESELIAIASRRQVQAVELPQALGGELEWIVMKCLDRSRGQRWDDTRQLLENVQAYLEDRLIPDPAYKLRWLFWSKKFIRRHRLAFGMALAGMAVGLYFWWLPGTLELRVFPEDAQVQIDGHPVGTAPQPLLVKLGAGVHTVACSKPSYITQTHTVLLRRGERTAPPEIALSHHQGHLEVESYPPGAALHLANVDYFEKIRNLPVDTGNYDLSAFANECFDERHRITVSRDHLTTDRLSLEHGISWHYTSPSIQGFLILITNTLPEAAPLIVHNELERIIFLSARDGTILDSIPTPNSKMFTKLDLGREAGNVMVWGYEDQTDGVTVEALSASWPAKRLWKCQGPPVKFTQPGSVEVQTMPGSNAVAGVVLAGRDGHARVYDGRSGNTLRDIPLSETPLESPPALASWREDHHVYLLAWYQAAATEAAATALETKNPELALFDADSRACLWRKSVERNQKAHFVDLDHTGQPWVVLWNDQEWRLVNGLTGELSNKHELPGAIIGCPALTDAEGEGTNALIFMFNNGALPMLAVRPADGATLWQGPTNLDNPQFDRSAHKNQMHRTPQGAVLVRLADSLAAINATNGKPLWTIPGNVHEVLTDSGENCIYAAVEDEGILCLDFTGKTNWLLRLREDVRPWAVIPGEDGGKGNLLLQRWSSSISLAHWPRLLWEASASGPLQATPLVTAGGDGQPMVLQLGPWGNEVTMRGLDGSSGNSRWAGKERLIPNRSPALAKMEGDGTMDLVTVGSLDIGSGGRLIIKRAFDGKLIRAPSVKLDSWMTGTPAVADFRGVGSNDVAVSTWQNPRIALLDGYSGVILWQVPTEQPNMNSVLAADLDGDGLPDVLATSFDGHVYAVRGKDGKLLWKTVINPEGSWSVPTVADLNDDGTCQVIVTTTGGQLFVLNGLDGKTLWSPDLVGGLKVAGKAVVANVNRTKAIIAPMGNAGLVAYDWRQRRELWRSPAGYPVIASGVVCDLVQDGTKQIVAAGIQGDVFVLRLTDGKPLWHAKIGQNQIEADPVVADLDRDGVDDILIADHDFRLYAISGRKIVSGFGRNGH